MSLPIATVEFGICVPLVVTHAIPAQRWSCTGEALWFAGISAQQAGRAALTATWRLAARLMRHSAPTPALGFQAVRA